MVLAIMHNCKMALCNIECHLAVIKIDYISKSIPVSLATWPAFLTVEKPCLKS